MTADGGGAIHRYGPAPADTTDDPVDGAVEVRQDQRGHAAQRDRAGDRGEPGKRHGPARAEPGVDGGHERETDGTADEAIRLGCRVVVIPQSEFNHGGTRNRGRRGPCCFCSPRCSGRFTDLSQQPNGRDSVGSRGHRGSACQRLALLHSEK